MIECVFASTGGTRWQRRHEQRLSLIWRWRQRGRKKQMLCIPRLCCVTCYRKQIPPYPCSTAKRGSGKCAEAESFYALRVSCVHRDTSAILTVCVHVCTCVYVCVCVCMQRQTTQTTLRQRREESTSSMSKATLQFESHDPFAYLSIHYFLIMDPLEIWSNSYSHKSSEWELKTNYCPTVFNVNTSS